ncbi:MAG: LysR family transcriptional regulator [Candidatus Limnocylindrales bacterium]
MGPVQIIIPAPGGAKSECHTQQIRELERITGLTLFGRRPRGLEPTDAARALYPAAMRTLGGTNEAQSTVAELRGLSQGRLRLAASLTIATYSIPGALGALAAQYPGVDVSLRVGNSHQVAIWTRQGAVELGFVEGNPDTDLERHPYQRDVLVLIGRGDGTPDAIDVAAIADLPMILREPGSGTRALVDERLLRFGVVVSPRLELGSPEAIKRLVEAGLGYSFLPRLAVERELSEGRLREVAVHDLDLDRMFCWLSRPAESLSPAARAFTAILPS